MVSPGERKRGFFYAVSLGWAIHQSLTARANHFGRYRDDYIAFDELYSKAVDNVKIEEYHEERLNAWGNYKNAEKKMIRFTKIAAMFYAIQLFDTIWRGGGDVIPVQNKQRKRFTAFHDNGLIYSRIVWDF